MDEQIQLFMESMIEKPAKKEFLERLNEIRKGNFIHIGDMDDFAELYGLE
ncbi:hypothetical protein [Methanococcoides methylutens]|nr:hypothetical protein [Methanococcoides methylutens]